MGFIKKDVHVIKNLGIELPTAYAKIGNISISESGRAHATFNVQQSREDVIQKNPLERISIITNIDKTQPIYTQIYNAAKDSLFADWEDDIVEVEETTEEGTEEATE